MVHKICANPTCSRELGDVHGNQQFCVVCTTKRRQDQNRASQQRRRLKKKYPQLIPQPVSQQIDDLPSAEIEAIIEGVWKRLVETTIIPLFLQLDQRIQQLKIRVNYIAGARTPEWWVNALTLADMLMETFSEQPLNKIRQALQKNLCIPKDLAIQVMQRARNENRFRQSELEWFR